MNHESLQLLLSRYLLKSELSRISSRGDEPIFLGDDIISAGLKYSGERNPLGFDLKIVKIVI